MELILSAEIEQKIHDYAMSVPGEIAGMGRVRVEGNERVIVEDVMIYEQEVSGATADLSTQALARFQTELVRAGESPKDWRLWFHSHANMQAFFSQRDTDTIDASDEGDWIVSLVVNKRRERKARLDLYRPFRMYMDDMDIIVEDAPASYTVPEDIADEVARKVKQRTYTPTPTGTHVGYHIQEDDTPRALAELYQNVATLEKQLAEQLDIAADGRSSDMYKEILVDLVDAYYELSNEETDPVIAEAIRDKADKLEKKYYAFGSMFYD